MSVPDDERFRNILEEDNHEHHIVKVSQGDDGEFTMRKFGSFTRVTDSFCFETEDLKNQTLCYLTVTTGDSEEEEGKPVCNHGVSTTTAVIQAERKCPHEDGALDSFFLCESKISDFQKEHKENIKILDSNKKRYHKLNRTSKYRMEIRPGDNSTTFNFLDLCKSNGEHYLGNYPRNIETKNCKTNLKVCLTLMERDHDDWDQKLSTIADIESCQHEHECEFLTQHERRDGKHESFSVSKDGNNSPPPPPPPTATTVINIEKVGTLGSICGKNNKNESINDQSMAKEMETDSKFSSERSIKSGHLRNESPTPRRNKEGQGRKKKRGTSQKK